VPILLLNRPIAFPVAAIRKALTEQLPEIAWRVGEEDFGAGNEPIPLDRPQTIIGRIDGAVILISVEQRHSAYEPANGHSPPEHRAHVAMSRPSTEDGDLARLIVLTIGASLAVSQDDSAHLQFEHGGHWYASVDVRALLRSAADDPGLAQRGLIGTPERSDDAEPDQKAAPPAEAPAVTECVEAPPAETEAKLDRFSILLEPPQLRRPGGFGRKGL
jgi:hypothetical protein